MGKRPLGGYRGATPSSWSATSRTGEWDGDQQFKLNKDSQWPSPPPPPYLLERSVRFNSSDSAYLSRTPSASPTSTRKLTYSTWVKRASFGSYQGFALAASGRDGIYMMDTEQIAVFFAEGVQSFTYTQSVFRDPSAWYHFVIAVDTTQATPANRISIYVNNVLQPLTGSYPSQNYDFTNLNASGKTQSIGYALAASQYFNGYLAEIYCIDGLALDPTSFGEFDDNGIWQPIEYTGSYGTNGFHLPFSDNSTAAALGTDTSGNSNTWTVNNISVASGAGNDSVVDVPTNGSQTDTGLGGEVRGNYCTLNAVNKGLDATLSNGNLDISYGTSSSVTGTPGTIGVSSGKWYWEVTPTGGTGSNAVVGIVNTTANSSVSSGIGYYVGYTTQGWGYFGGDGTKRNGSGTSYGATFTTNDVIGIAFDADNGTLVFYKNGASQGTAFTGLTSGPYFPAVSDASEASSLSMTCNFGQRPFAYTAPSGFKALNTANLGDPVVTKPSTVMDVVLYTGTGATKTISGLGFSPDFVWIKKRSASGGHPVFDTIRGATNYLQTHSTGAEGTDTDALTAFTSDGFTLGTGYTIVDVNQSSATYVAWTWDAGSSTVTNTDGSITSSVRANPSAGFSIVTYTGNGTAGATIGHGLGVQPHMVIYNNRDSATDWIVGHVGADLLNAPNQKRLILNGTQVAVDDGGSYFNDTNPTSSVITLGNHQNVNESTKKHVGYFFAPVAGYSSFGSYTGNGSTDGPFIYTGMRPRFLLIKQTNTARNWYIWDAVRNTYNVVDAWLVPNTSDAELATLDVWDFVSNGFKLRDNNASWNASGGTYIYAAFAESPFQYARAR